MGIKKAEALTRNENETDEEFEARKAAALAEPDDDEGEEESAIDGEGEEGGEGGEESGELLIAIGAEPSPGSDPDDDNIDGKPAPQWVKDLRAKAKADAQRIRELESQVSTGQKPPEQIIVGDKPTMESCDYDQAKFETELAAWMQREAQAKEQTRAREEEQRKATEAWAAKESRFRNGKAALIAKGAKGVDDALAAVEAKLSPQQRGIIVNSAKDSALVLVALGKAPEKLAELAKLSDPIDFAFAISKVEDQVKTKGSSNRGAGNVDTGVRGNSGSTAGSDKTLARLRAEAERTGNYTKVREYKQSLKRAASE